MARLSSCTIVARADAAEARRLGVYFDVAKDRPGAYDFTAARYESGGNRDRGRRHAGLENSVVRSPLLLAQVRAQSLEVGEMDDPASAEDALAASARLEALIVPL